MENIDTLPYGLPKLSKHPGLPFEIKETPESFVVDELWRLPETSEDGKYAYFLLKKEGISTTDAILAVCRAIGAGARDISCAGQKDRQARTTQLCSTVGMGRAALENAQLPKQVSVEFLGRGGEQVKIGSLDGNRFVVRAGGIDGTSDAPRRIQEIFESNSGRFPNYFGVQRFGSRQNTHIVGKMLAQGRLQDAAEEYIAGCWEGESEDKTNARERIVESWDFQEALGYFPRALNYERMMIAHLAAKPHDYAGAFMCLPRQVLLIFVHACQSYLFNIHLGMKVEGGEISPDGAGEGEMAVGENSLGFPDVDLTPGGERAHLALRILGAGSEPNRLEQEILDAQELRISDFKVSKIPSLNAKGGWRSALAPMRDFAFEEGVFSFSLPSGAYATCALREFWRIRNTRGS